MVLPTGTKSFRSWRRTKKQAGVAVERGLTFVRRNETRWLHPSSYEGGTKHILVASECVMFLIKGKTERSSFGVGVESATEALAQRRQLIERQMTVEVMDVRGQLVSLEDLQWLADAEARFAKTARRE